MPEEKHIRYKRPLMIGDTMYFPVPKDLWYGEDSWLDIREEEVENVDGTKQKRPEEIGFITDKGKHGKYLGYFNPRQQRKQK